MQRTHRHTCMHTVVKARGWCVVRAKRPLLKKEPCFNLSPHQRNQSVFESYFFPNLLVFKQIVNYWIPKPGCPPGIIQRAADQPHRLQELENTERNSLQRALQPRSARAEGPGCFFFFLHFFSSSFFLFKPGVILWVQFNIWEEGGIWIFIILW